ncbi:hypothetical protein [Nannocystis pusilla]|uniref:hypothetical protein n=1 Tax=Nannocystis pusilla TaxID=889268 RepID=UPI003B7EDD81
MESPGWRPTFSAGEPGNTADTSSRAGLREPASARWNSTIIPVVPPRLRCLSSARSSAVR